MTLRELKSLCLGGVVSVIDLWAPYVHCIAVCVVVFSAGEVLHVDPYLVGFIVGTVSAVGFEVTDRLSTAVGKVRFFMS